MMMKTKCLTDEHALDILKSDKLYLRTDIAFDYALINAIEALEDKVKAKDNPKNTDDKLDKIIKMLDSLVKCDDDLK